MALEILSETPINASQLKEELAKIKQRDKELNFRAAKTEEHLDHIGANKNAEAIFDKITKLDIPRLKEQHIHKMIDMMPATVKDLKVVMQSRTVTLNNETMKKIADIISSYTEKK